MKEARAKTVELIFHEALAKPEADREKFLAEACHGNQELHQKVASLLRAHKDGLLEGGPFALFAKGSEPSPTFPEGARISSYRIVRLLGKGGMGEVYEAYDERLKRRVALKTLPQSFAGDAARVERLQREARAASALNHPNILTIYDFGREAGTDFIVSELVEGVSLRELIGELSPAEALDYARQIGEALHAAHAAGIVHRDIKPENVMVRRDGYLKVLDFGLAKIQLSPPPDESMDQQTTQHDVSIPGLIIGTINYMSPEQVRGQVVDFRTDIWSWGVVLYEMLTGRRPFDTVAAIVKQEPVPPCKHPELNRIVAKALSKPVETRYQGMAEALRDLAGLRLQSRRWPSWRRTYLWAALALFIALAGTGARYYWVYWTSLHQPIRLESMVPLTTSGNVTLGTISPDGNYAAYASQDRRGQSLRLVQIGTKAETERLAPAQGVYTGITFSPDGRFLYYVFQQNRVGKLYRLALLGGDPRLVADDVDSPVGFSPDGSQFVFKRDSSARQESSLMIRSVDDGRETMLATLKIPNAFWPGPIWSRDGAFILCAAYASTPSKLTIKIVSIRLRDKVWREMPVDDWKWVAKPAWIKSGRGILVAAMTIHSNRAQIAQALWPEGTITPVSHDTEDYMDLDATVDSTRVIGVSMHRESSLWVVPLAAPDQPRLVAGGRFNFVASTHSGSIISQTETGGELDLWSIDVKSGKMRPLTDDPYTKQDPAPTADQKYVVYSSDRDGSYHLWRSNSDGTNPVRLTSGPTYDRQPAVTPDSRWIVYTSIRGGLWALWKVSIDGGDPTQITSPMAEQPDVSPDGKFIACNYAGPPYRQWSTVILRSDTGQLVRSFPALPGEARVRWSADGKFLLYFVTTDGVSNLWAQPAGGGSPTQLTHFTQETIFAASPSPDGKWVALIRGRETSNLVLLETAN
jgi:Tol biopolymer transport system component/tRNA A-37 threonylcarbamoyl transferase component Bud32